MTNENNHNYIVGVRHGELLRKKFNRRSIRIKSWDYSENGYYFVTINTHEGKYLFGNVESGRMIKTSIGEITEKYFKEIPSHFNDVKIDVFQVMPNHVHGIIIIDHVGVRHNHNCVGVSHGKPLQKYGYQERPKGSIGVMINLFKQAVTIWCNKMDHANFQWQRNYWEHVIRNETELLILQNYILNNPPKWEYDRNNLDSRVPLKKRGVW